MSLSLHPDFHRQSRNRRYLLGISGGRDSVALLHLLLAAGYRKLILCHLNHGLRGKDSGQDAAWVRRLAKQHMLTCDIEKADVRKRMEQTGESLELAARNSRRQFFRECARRHRCNRILLAHHADDQVETILFNLLRGSAGLRGMEFATTHAVHGRQLEFSRPLLSATRKQIDQFLAENKINYREDASNAEAVATRNRLRHEAIPLLAEIMGREIGPSVLRAYDISHAEHKAVDELLGSMQLTDPQQRLFLPKLTDLPPALQMRVIHHFLKESGIGDISHDLLQRCTRLLTDKSQAKVNLPGGKYFHRKEKRLFIS